MHLHFYKTQSAQGMLPHIQTETREFIKNVLNLLMKILQKILYSAMKLTFFLLKYIKFIWYLKKLYYKNYKQQCLNGVLCETKDGFDRLIFFLMLSILYYMFWNRYTLKMFVSNVWFFPIPLDLFLLYNRSFVSMLNSISLPYHRVQKE